MISLWIEQARGLWYGVAHHGERLVATATGADRARAARSVRTSLPRGREVRMVKQGSKYARDMVRLLARLEAGEEEAPSFELCPDCVGEPLVSVARVASAIPRGFVATYGGIAAAAGTEARVVGHVMATNPLYPIIPCHRVVGADLSLVGYGGKQDEPALRAKLERLRAETRGLAGSPARAEPHGPPCAHDAEAPRIAGARGPAEAWTVATPLDSVRLAIYPVERVIAKAARDGLDGAQLSLW